RDLAEEAQASLELPGLDPRDEADRAIEQPHEDEEGREPVLELGELGVLGMRLDRLMGLRQRPFEDRDDRVALAELALGDDPSEPFPMVTDRSVGRAGGPTATDPSRLLDALDDSPLLSLGQGQARRP